MTDTWESGGLVTEVWESNTTPGVEFNVIVREGDIVASGGGGTTMPTGASGQVPQLASNGTDYELKTPNTANGLARLDGSATLPDILIPASIARDSEVTAAVNAAVSALVGSAPGLLDTLDELAAALGDDATFASTMAAALAGKQPLDSDLSAIAALSTTSYGRALLELANLAALQGVLGTGTPSASTFLRGDGSWATPAGGSVATDTIWDAAGDVVYGTGADAATRLALGTRGMALVAGATAPEWAFITPRLPIPMAAGDYVLLSAPYGTGNQNATFAGSVATSVGMAYYVPFFVGKRIGVSSLTLEVATGNTGTGTGRLRMGIHANNAGRPGAVVIDAGQATTTAAVKELSFTEVFLDPGWYFAVAAFQTLDTASTNPAVRAVSASVSTAAPRTAVPGSTANPGVSFQATVTGALAANPTVTALSPVIPHIWLKVSTI